MLPSIETMQLTLRPFLAADLIPLYQIQSDPQAMQYTYRAATLDEFTAHIYAYLNLETTIGYAPWVIVERATAQICGWGGLCIDPFAPGWGVELSYYFAQSVWGRGYATELTQATLAYGFDTLHLPCLGAFAHPENKASNRVLEKCGFRLLGYEPALARNHYEIQRAAWRPLTSKA